MKKVSKISEITLCLAVAGLTLIKSGLVLAAPEEIRETTVEFLPPTANEDLIGFVNTIGAWFYKLGIPMAVIVIIFAGAMMMLSQGNPEVIKRSRKMLTYAMIGLAVLLIGRGFFTLIKSIIELGK